MQPLATTRRMMTWLSMCPPDDSSNERQKRAYVAHTLAVLFFNLMTLTASALFCFKYVSSDFNGAAFAFMLGIGEFGLIYFMIAATLMCHQIDSIFTSLSTIYKSNENEVAFRYLTRANNKSESMWMIYVNYSKVSVGGIGVTSLISVLYCYLTRGNFNVDYFYRPGRYVLPWNQTTLLGYFAEIFTAHAFGYSYLILNGTPLLLFISLCLHHQAFYKMFKHKIDKAEHFDAELMCNLIGFHISAKDLFLDSAKVYSPFVLVELICGTVMMTVSVFYIDLQWHHFDFTVFTVMVSTSVGMSTLFIYCFSGKLATKSYEMMSDCVYNDMKWYEQPIELQKRYILMIANMRKPVYYHGFEVAKLDLQTFVKLCNKVYSYYMVIKTLAAK